MSAVANNRVSATTAGTAAVSAAAARTVAGGRRLASWRGWPRSFYFGYYFTGAGS